MARPKGVKHWLYVVRENDEYELPVLVTDQPKEVVDFLGYANVNSLYTYFCRDKRKKTEERVGPYKLERFEDE